MAIYCLTPDSFVRPWLLGMCPRAYICQPIQYTKFVSVIFHHSLNQLVYMMFQKSRLSAYNHFFIKKLLVLLRSPTGIYSDIKHSFHFLKETCVGILD